MCFKLYLPFLSFSHNQLVLIDPGFVLFFYQYMFACTVVNIDHGKLVHIHNTSLFFLCSLTTTPHPVFYTAFVQGYMGAIIWDSQKIISFFGHTAVTFIISGDFWQNKAKSQHVHQSKDKVTILMSFIESWPSEHLFLLFSLYFVSQDL